MRKRKSRSRMEKKLRKMIRRWKKFRILLPLYKNKGRLGSGLYGILYVLKYCVLK